MIINGALKKHTKEPSKIFEKNEFLCNISTGNVSIYEQLGGVRGVQTATVQLEGQPFYLARWSQSG